MMGERMGAQEALFYGFSLEGHVPPDHMLRSIDRFVDLGDMHHRGFLGVALGLLHRKRHALFPKSVER